MPSIDLNCDLGESFGRWTLGDDAAMLAVVTSANIACGFHAGDPSIMHATVQAAMARGVGIGAHPGYLDLYGFGRRNILGDTPRDIERQTAYQVGALMGVAANAGGRVTHVKTHGALGNRAAEEPELAEAVARAIRSVDRELAFVVMPGMATERAGEAQGLRVVREIYADRAYADSGNLAPRSQPGAVIEDSAAAAQRVVAMLETGAIVCASGKRIPAAIESVCVHGDTTGAAIMARELRAALQAAGYTVAGFAAPASAKGTAQT
ncbi:MAG TPA: 5-oxoprolinase subunit PxpA [Xanthobacteraceae bacterium]|nr:5-oxoprolinase subunit PxpA [Xanthobacteraceae bacterium]